MHFTIESDEIRGLVKEVVRETLATIGWPVHRLTLSEQEAGKDPWRGPAGTPWDWDSWACFLTPVFYFALDHAGMRSWRGAYETAKLDHCGGRRREMSAELGPSHRRCDWCAATWTRENAIDAAEDVLKIGLTAT